MCQRARLRAIAAATPGGRLWVNLRHEHFVPTGRLNPKLPPLQMHPQAAAVRHKPPSAADAMYPRIRRS